MASILKLLAPLHATGKWLILAAVVGVVAGMGAIAFDAADQTIRHFAQEGMAGYVPAETAGEHRLFKTVQNELSPTKLILVMAFGGLLSGLLVFTFAPEAEGRGADAAIASWPSIEVSRLASRPRISSVWRLRCFCAGPSARDYST